MRSSGAEKSNTFSPLSPSYTMVPTGTLSSTLSPSRPVLLAPSPWRPRSALYSGLKRKWTRVLWRSLDSMTTSPPLPPSPPEGPPRGTNFSRRNARQPLPPLPAFTRIVASSINTVVRLRAVSENHACPADLPAIKLSNVLGTHTKAPAGAEAGPRRARLGRSLPALLRFHGLDHDELAHAALIEELDASRDLGKERVVLAAADVEPGFYPGAALAHDDGSARHQLPAERFESQPLGIGVAAVA